MAALPDKAPSFFFLDIQAPTPSASTPSSTRRRRARRSSACRCCAGASWRRTASRPRSSSRRRAPPGCCKATAASPSRTRSRPARASSRANGGSRTMQGPPLVSFEKKIADGLGLKLGDPVTVNVLGRNHHGAHRQSAHARLAEPRHQFRDGVLARDLPRRAGDPHRHAHLSGRQHRRPRRPRCSRRRPTPSRPSPRCGCATRSTPSARSSPTWCSRSAAPARSRCWWPCWCWAARSRPATATGSTTRWCSRRWARRARRLLAAYALEYLLIGLATAVFGVAAGSVAAALRASPR